MHRRDADALRKVLGCMRAVHKAAEPRDLVEREIRIDEIVRRLLHADAAQELGERRAGHAGDLLESADSERKNASATCESVSFSAEWA